MASTMQTITATGGAKPVKIELGTFRRGVGLIVTIPDGSSAKYDVEVTGTPLDQDTKIWNKHDILQDKEESANSNLAFPVTAVRINPSSITGTIYFAVVQVEG